MYIHMNNHLVFIFNNPREILRGLNSIQLISCDKVFRDLYGFCNLLMNKGN